MAWSRFFCDWPFALCYLQLSFGIDGGVVVASAASSDSFPDCRTIFVKNIGDGSCELVLNNEECGYDGGDCCACTCVDGLEVACGSIAYECIDPSVSSDCVSDGSFECASDFFGDGDCDDVNNVKDCVYDGGGLLRVYMHK